MEPTQMYRLVQGAGAVPLLDRDPLIDYPPVLLDSLAAMATSFAVAVFLTGGVVRDWLAGRKPCDLDLTVPGQALDCARWLASRLGGTFVPLDEGEGVARVVWQGLTIDLGGFREGTASIEADLARRDFTINALGLAFDPGRRRLAEPRALIDPTGGLADLRARRLRLCHPGALAADPLRALRAYRFMACLDLSMEAATGERIAGAVETIRTVAGERIRHELDLLMASGRAASAVAAMAESRLLDALLPELACARGLAQPASHHLDVFFHSLATLQSLEAILAAPERFFRPGQVPAARNLAASAAARRLLAHAALLHDLGKVPTAGRAGERITFYSHDRVGGELVAAVAERLRWSRADSRRLVRLVAGHMWPFHLANVRRRTGSVTPRAGLRLVKAHGDDLASLFVLAMADAQAGQGPDKPADTEAALAALFAEVDTLARERVRPVLAQPRLLTGRHLIDLFGLAPGPIFARILQALEEAQVDGRIRTRQQAEAFVRDWLARPGAKPEDVAVLRPARG
ncbi:MAG: HD domain-containing protein [Thermodesulfobacteriota bacterium]